MIDPRDFFHRPRYLRSDFRRLEHLAALSLPIEHRRVLEIGAGIGDLTSFFLDRGCTVTATEPREQNVAFFRARYEQDSVWEDGRLVLVESGIGDIAKKGVGLHDVVFCYGVLNHLRDPESAIDQLAAHTSGFLVLEVACDSGENRDADDIRFWEANPADPSGSVAGMGAVPTRPWVFRRLKHHFAHVYVALLQPHFERFRVYWGRADNDRGQDRVIFVASRTPLDNPFLVDFIPTVQFRRLPTLADLPLGEGLRFVRTALGLMAGVEGDRSLQQGPNESDDVLELVDEGDLVYDFGAGIGMYALALGVAVGENGSVIASERRATHAAALERNVCSHGIRNVRCNTGGTSTNARVAFMRIDASGMSDEDRETAESIIRRDRPTVYADELHELAPFLSAAGYTELRALQRGRILTCAKQGPA